MLPGDNADNYNLKIAELEKKLIEENLEKMKMKFNDIVKSKTDL